MNKPEADKRQGAGTQSEADTRPLLRTTTWNGHQPGALERVLSKVNAALRPLIAAHLTEEHSLLFADAVTDPETGEVHWVSPIEGVAVSYLDLVPEDQAAIDSRVSKLLFDLTELARKLQTEPQTLEDYVMGQLLELPLDGSFSEKKYWYVVGYQPVVAFWAFDSPQTAGAFAAPTEVAPTHERAALVDSWEPTVADADPVVAVEPVAEVAPVAEAPGQRVSNPWTARQWAMAAGITAVMFFAIFGLNPRVTVVSWLDRMATIRAGEEALLRSLGRGDSGPATGLADAAPGAEVSGSVDGGVVPEAAAERDEPSEEVVEEFAEPMPPFETARGKLSIEKVQGSILLLHFWSSTDPAVCEEIGSFVSMVTSDGFDRLRELGGEAYLVTDEASVEKGNEFLKSCGIQDPFLLRDPGGAVLNSIAPGVEAPITVVFDKLTERTLATYPRRDWLDPAVDDELRRLLLMQAF